MLGWTHVAVAFVDDDAETQHGYAVSDNRTAQLSERDPQKLDVLLIDYSNEFAELSASADSLIWKSTDTRFNRFAELRDRPG